MVHLDLSILPDRLSVCRLPAGSALPPWADKDTLTAVTWTAEETSIVTATSAVPADVQSEGGWRAFAVAGPIDFTLTGILASLAQPLAEAGVGIFAISTYDTDYLLVKEGDLQRATSVLVAVGHRVA